MFEQNERQIEIDKIAKVIDPDAWELSEDPRIKNEGIRASILFESRVVAERVYEAGERVDTLGNLVEKAVVAEKIRDGVYIYDGEQLFTTNEALRQLKQMTSETDRCYGWKEKPEEPSFVWKHNVACLSWGSQNPTDKNCVGW